jgi:hypothetical protein
VTSERGGAAVLKGSEGFELLNSTARSVPGEESLALHAEDVGHLHGGPGHRFFLRWYRRLTSCRQESGKLSRGLATARKWRWDRCRYFAVVSKSP